MCFDERGESGGCCDVSGLQIKEGVAIYRRSGNFRVKNISSDKFSRCLIFVDEPTDEN